MKLDLKCVPYIRTYGSDKFKKFVNTAFNEKFIASKTDKDAILFRDWQVKDKGNYRVYTNTSNTQYMIEVYSVGYNIITLDGSKHIPVHPQTIDQFITDCERCGLDLYWDEKIFHILTYNEILEPKTIEEYHGFLLEKLGKDV